MIEDTTSNKKLNDESKKKLNGEKLAKNFFPADFECEVYNRELKFFAEAFSRESENVFSIVLPPPNVTGSLHLGHSLNVTLQDILVRFKIMNGFKVLFQPGLDHAGISTQMVVERNLEKIGKTRKEIGREEFLKCVWDWKEQSGGMILDQLKRLGSALNWDRVRFSMDEGLSIAVRKVFVSLYKDGLIYKSKKLVNWDPKFKTAISDLEVINKNEKGKFWYIKYPLDISLDISDYKCNKRVDDNHIVTVCDRDFIIIATTRPETMFGDTAVAVHPNDDRYKNLIGKYIRLPLTKRLIPVISDEYCDPKKGTGAVKITPAHDFNDFEVGERHGLEKINILDENAHLNQSVPDKYVGLSIEDARKTALEDLEKLGLIVKEEIIEHTIPYGDRSNVQIQPWLTDQWFLNAKELSVDALNVVENGDIEFIPAQWKNTYDSWMKNIQPWCISRQLWWGHRIPAWYGPDGSVFVEETEEDAIKKAKEKFGDSVVLKQDDDVLDTWFSSAFWPFSTLGWPDKTEELKVFYPNSVLITGFDIIFFWVARMIMMGLYVMKEIPFKKVYIHSLVRDESGQKMSKTKGNVTDPIELIDKFGADALRFTFATSSVPGRDIRLGENKVKISRNFITKIWNCARFLELNNAKFTQQQNYDISPKHELSHWILCKIDNLREEIEKNLENFRLDLASIKVKQFLWDDYCDIYLECIKPLLISDDYSEEMKSVSAYIFIQFLKLAHPFIPFVTERLFEEFLPNTDPIISSDWPKKFYYDVDLFKKVNIFVELLLRIRSIKGLLGFPGNYVIDNLISPIELESNKEWLSVMAKINKITPEKCHEYSKKEKIVKIPITIGDHNFYLEVESSIEDINGILQNKSAKLNSDIDKLSLKINNEEFKKTKPDIYAEDEQLFCIKKRELEQIAIIINDIKITGK